MPRAMERAPVPSNRRGGLPVSHVTKQQSKQEAAELNAHYLRVMACGESTTSRICSLLLNTLLMTLTHLVLGEIMSYY